MGGAILLAADLLARGFSQGAELPLSIWTVLFRGPGAHRTASSGKGGEPGVRCWRYRGLTAGYRRPVIREISLCPPSGRDHRGTGPQRLRQDHPASEPHRGRGSRPARCGRRGRDCLDWSARRRARSIALLSQHSQLPPACGRREVIAMGRTPGWGRSPARAGGPGHGPGGGGALRRGGAS